jgi:hypothetical protein
MDIAFWQWVWLAGNRHDLPGNVCGLLRLTGHGLGGMVWPLGKVWLTGKRVAYWKWV